MRCLDLTCSYLVQGRCTIFLSPSRRYHQPTVPTENQILDDCIFELNHMTDESNSKVSDHYRAVELKCSATSLNCNTDGLVRNGLLQTLLAVHRYIFIAVDGNNLCIFLQSNPTHISNDKKKKKVGDSLKLKGKPWRRKIPC